MRNKRTESSNGRKEQSIHGNRDLPLIMYTPDGLVCTIFSGSVGCILRTASGSLRCSTKVFSAVITVEVQSESKETLKVPRGRHTPELRLVNPVFSTGPSLVTYSCIETYVGIYGADAGYPFTCTCAS